MKLLPGLAALSATSASILPTRAQSGLISRDPGAGFLASSANKWFSSDAPIQSLDGGISFHFQVDGNFVVYGPSGPVWNSATTGKSCGNGNCFLTFQTDGNFVAYEGLNNPQAYWSTGTNSYAHHEIPAAGLFFRNTVPYIQLYSGHNADGNLVLMWETVGATGYQSWSADPKDPPPVNPAPNPPALPPPPPLTTPCDDNCDGTGTGGGGDGVGGGSAGDGGDDGGGEGGGCGDWKRWFFISKRDCQY